jgi:hypothetical protein
LGHNIDTKKMTPGAKIYASRGSAVILAGHLTEFTPSNATSTGAK